jgi:hypothetical protein
LSYEWVRGRLPGGPQSDELPTRLANAVTAVSGRAGELLVLNPHPETWNNWQLPYASFSNELDRSVEARTFQELETVLQRTLDLASSETRTRAEREIAASLGVKAHLGEASIAETYALRFSKTAGVWTAYRFAYVPARIEVPPTLQQTGYLPLSGDECAKTAETGSWRGLQLSDNLLMILRDEALRGSIETALEDDAAAAS